MALHLVLLPHVRGIAGGLLARSLIPRGAPLVTAAGRGVVGRGVMRVSRDDWANVVLVGLFLVALIIGAKE